MGALSPRVTRQRVLGGLAFFVVTMAMMYVLGADMPSLLPGAMAGMALVGAIAALLWVLARREAKSSPARDEP